MRNLKDWLGYRAKYQGTVAQLDENRMLLTDVKVQLYSSEEYNPRLVDHLWMYKLPEQDEVSRPECRKGDVIVGLADVVEYRRRDRTVDYGLKQTHTLDLGDELVRYARRSLKAHLDVLHRMLADLQRRQLFISLEATPSQMKRLILENISKCEECIKLEERAKRAQLRGRLTADPVRFKTKIRKEKARGFV